MGSTPTPGTLERPLTFGALQAIFNQMKIQLTTKPLSEVKDYLVIPVFEAQGSDFKNKDIQEFLKENPKFGKLYESYLFFSTDHKTLLVGLGKKDQLDFGRLQNYAGVAVRNLNTKTKVVALVIPKIDNLRAEAIGEAVAIGVEMASQDITTEYKSEAEAPKLTQVEILVERAERGYQDGLKKGLVIAEGINLSRRLGDMPPNEMTPTYFLNAAKKLAKDYKLKLTVLDEKQAKRKGMGAFVGVAQGSDEPSFMIALEYAGDIRSKEKWGFAGKGITFDTGGISIKPDNGMWEMKYDMCGAAAVMSTMLVIAKLGLKINACGVMAVTENLPSGRAQRPGDIVKTYSGKTAEIHSTDAEGRLVLVDVLSFIQKDLKATKLVDLATLTGAALVALGHTYTAAMGNNSEFMQRVIEAGKRVGEKMWELPMDEEYNELIKAPFADILNIGTEPRSAGTIVGAKFLEAVIEDNRPWVHLDIAGTAWTTKPMPYASQGATGVGIKTLISLVCS